MAHRDNPQHRQMADESMVRNLAAQAEAIWPLELPVVDAHGLAPDARILDVGCGTGEIARRLADRFAGARITGVDLIPEHLDYAAARNERHGARLAYAVGNAFTLPFADGTFDLAV